MQKLSVILSFLTKFIQECLQKDKELLTGPPKYTSPKAFLYQMYFIISKLDERSLTRMNFLINFGVTMDNIHVMSETMESGGTYEEVREGVFKNMDLL